MKLKAFIRRILTLSRTLGKSGYLSHGEDLHIGKGTLLWAPSKITIGKHVYIGKNNNIEANCEIGDYCLFANNVAIVGRHDHDMNRVGFPVRYAPWIGSAKIPSPHREEAAVIEQEVWLGYGVIVLTGVTIGRGAVVAAGSVVTRDLPAYCIAAGAPARPIGSRFSDPTVIAEHEYSLLNGEYRLSEAGYDDCIIKPKLPSEMSR